MPTHAHTYLALQTGLFRFLRHRAGMEQAGDRRQAPGSPPTVSRAAVSNMVFTLTIPVRLSLMRGLENKEEGEEEKEQMDVRRNRQRRGRLGVSRSSNRRAM